MISARGRPRPDRTLAGRGEGAAGLSRWLRRGHRRQGWLSPPDHAPGTTEPFAGPFSFPHPHLLHGQTTGLGGEEGTPPAAFREEKRSSQAHVFYYNSFQHYQVFFFFYLLSAFKWTKRATLYLLVPRAEATCQGSDGITKGQVLFRKQLVHFRVINCP